MKLIQIDDNNQGQRVDKFMLKLLPGMSKSFCFKMFRKKNIKLNGRKILGSEILRSGDELKVFFADETYDKFMVKEGRGIENEASLDDKVITLPEIVFEDEQVIVINKSAGIFSQNDPKGISVSEQIETYYKSQDLQLSTGVKVGVSNRLDRNTTGVILSGKTLPMTRAMNHAIKERKVQKLYRTIVAGVHYKKVELIGHLVKDRANNKVRLLEEVAGVKGIGNDAEFIHTIIRPLRSSSDYTELEVEIKTGKPHQIRVHLASVGTPIIGDTKYGDAYINKCVAKEFGLKHQLLHAYSYRFMDDETLLRDYKEAFIAPLPKVYERIAEDVFK